MTHKEQELCDEGFIFVCSSSSSLGSTLKWLVGWEAGHVAQSVRTSLSSVVDQLGG